MIVGLGIRQALVCEILEVNIASFALKASYCSKGAPQKCKSKLCSNVGHYRCIRLPGCDFQLFFQTVFC